MVLERTVSGGCNATRRPAVAIRSARSPTVEASESQTEDPIMAVAKKCEQCGNVDTRVTWPSAQDAAKDPVFAKLDLPELCLDGVRPRRGRGRRPSQPAR